ncbi:growth hormone secretagogue receptor type 1 isoform X2 [Paramormyrops kingsleyae]|uniref:growth hormone secretagogue receptor type 1 isoform X2 n=1 Tax=Paramormyrops kingsleyae TaxID=1676925 RepID=UPI003B979CD5
MMDPIVGPNVSVAGCWDGCGNDSDMDRHFTYHQEPLFSSPELVLVTTVCVLLLVVGLVGNTLTVLVVRLRRDLRSTTYIYLCSMAFSDIIILLLMPIDLYKLWNFQPWLLGDVICKLSQFLSEGCTFASILHITALSVERYLAVCFPLHAKVLVTRGKVKALIGVLWMVALLSAGPVFALPPVRTHRPQAVAPAALCPPGRGQPPDRQDAGGHRPGLRPLLAALPRGPHPLLHVSELQPGHVLHQSVLQPCLLCAVLPQRSHQPHPLQHHVHSVPCGGAQPAGPQRLRSAGRQRLRGGHAACCCPPTLPTSHSPAF